MDHPTSSTSRPRSAYVHVPFCRHRCGYCNFTLVAGRDDLFDDYLRAIEMELRELRRPRPVDTLFLGGGTPTHLTPTVLGELLRLVTTWFPLNTEYEFSVEANPEDVTSELVDVLHGAGVNRVSLGVQSFSDRKLAVLERGHRADDVARGVELLRPRIANLAMDLIFAAPAEPLTEWQSDLRQAVDLRPTHISTYGLTYERGARFFARQRKSLLAPAGEDLERSMYELAIDRFGAAGFEHYEVSNFARPGFRSRHNENYWLGGEFFGVGPGAASYIAGRRQTNHRSTTTYLRRILAGQSPAAESERLAPEDRAREHLVFGLRRLDGVSASSFARSTGFEIRDLIGRHLDWLVDQRLLRWTGDTLHLTHEGLLVSDSIWPYLL